MKTVYKVIDRQTGKQVGKDYTTSSRARLRVDNLDNAYGAYRYYVQVIYPIDTVK